MTSISTNTTNSFFPNNLKEGSKRSGNQPALLHSGTNSASTNNSLLSYRNNESTFKTDEEDNAAGADKTAPIVLAGDKAQDSDSAQHSLMDSLINQTKQKFLPKSSKRKAEKLSKKQRKQEKEQRMKEEQQRKLKKEHEEQCNDITLQANKTSNAIKGKLGETDTNELQNGTSTKADMGEDDVKIKKEHEDVEKNAIGEKKDKTQPFENNRLKPNPAVHTMHNGKDSPLKGSKGSNLILETRDSHTHSLTSTEPMDALTTSTADTNTTGASSTAGTATTTSATDTNTDNATTTEDDDDDDMPLAAKKNIKANAKKKGKKKTELGQKYKDNTASENDSQEEMEVATAHKGKSKEEILKTKQNTPSSPSKVSKPKGLVDSLSKYFTPGGRRAVTSRTALSSLIGSASSPTRRSADSAIAMIHAANANSSDILGIKRKRGSTAFLSGSSDGEDSQDMKGCLNKAAKKSKRNKSLDSASHGPNTLVNLKKSVAGTSSAHSDSETGTGGLHDRKRHTSSGGGGQLRSLYDGLSHLYTDCDSRLRHIPSTNYAPEKRRKLASEALFQESGNNIGSAFRYLLTFNYLNIDQTH